MAAPKGHPKWGGRGKGTPNKNYLDPQKWAQLIWEAAHDANLSNKEIIELGFRGLGMLFTKIQMLPGTPAQSVENVAKLLESYEHQKIEKVESETAGTPNA